MSFITCITSGKKEEEKTFKTNESFSSTNAKKKN